MPRSIEREVLNVVQELSAADCSKVLGVLLEFCDGRTPNTHDREQFLFVAVFFAIGGSW